MNEITPMYSCDVCGLSVRPSDSTVSRLTLVWLRGKGKTVASIEQEQFRYRHDVCKGLNGEDLNQPPLF
jgi:hypothetical protein